MCTSCYYILEYNKFKFKDKEGHLSQLLSGRYHLTFLPVYYRHGQVAEKVMKLRLKEMQLREGGEQLAFCENIAFCSRGVTQED